MVSYLFTKEHIYNNVYYDDFLRISARLNKHYSMERKDRWKDTTLKDNLSRIGYAVLKGDVVIEEKYEDSIITIIHTLLYSDEFFRHGLVFASQEYVRTMKSKNIKTN